MVNAANEEAVALYLKGKIGFLDISRLVRAALEHSPIGGGETVEEIEELDRETRRRTREMLIG